MAYDVPFKMSMQNAAGDYYIAEIQRNNTYEVTTDPVLTYVDSLPEGWDRTKISWERNLSYFGIFRSGSQNFTFQDDSRAILLSILYGNVGGINAYCKLNIYKFNEVTFEYDVFYSSEIDFSTNKDDKQNKKLTVETLDSRLIGIFKSRVRSAFNIPFWTYNSGTELFETDAKFIEHDGIKLLWEANYTSGATSTSTIKPTPAGLFPFNHGSATTGRHWIPAMNQYNITQNNGTTTFIGNDILQPLLLQNNQPFNYNLNFNGTDDIQAYTKNQCLLKNLLPNPTDTDVVSVNIEVNGQFAGDIDYDSSTGATDKFIRVVLFEIDNKDEPITVAGNYQYTTLYTQLLPDGGEPFTPPDSGIFSSVTAVDLNYDKAYVVGIIYDAISGGLSFSEADFELSAIDVKISSNYNSGTSTAVDAPKFPTSVFPAYRPDQLLQKLVDVLDSTRTDAYGFPIPLGSGYVGESDYLSDDALDPDTNYNNFPYWTYFTSGNALRNIKGIPYMNISMGDFFDVCLNIWGLGLGIVGDDTVKIEPLAYWFDKDTVILDLGSDVANFQIIPFTELMGNNIKAGYGETQTNTNFGVDAFCIQTEYDLPQDKVIKSIDRQTGQVVTEMYRIEKMRAQNNGNNSPSASNDNVLIECDYDFVGTVSVSPPAGANQVKSKSVLKKYPTAQSTTPASPPYIKGLFYPDSAYNLGLTPLRNIHRSKEYWRSLTDQYGLSINTDYISYRKQYQQQYNDPTAPATTLPSISVDLDGSGVLSEVEDIDITTLGAKLFKPYIFRFESGYPVNLYTLINTNPRGVIQFTFDNVDYSGFIYKVEQQANGAATTFELIAHPLTSNAALGLN